MKDTYSKIKDNYNCPFNLIDDLIGGKWKLRIVAHIINGDNRFSILQKKIDDMKSSFESAQTTLLSFFSSTDKFNSLPVSSIKEVQYIAKE